MSRCVVKTAKKPHEVKPQKNPVFICMCGLSKNQPFCDSSHLKTQDEKEGVIYTYNERNEKHECNCACDKNEECCCGHE